MDKFVTVVGWFLALIFVYLLFTNASGATSIFNSAATAIQTESKILQGR